jgi:hypothetical protein
VALLMAGRRFLSVKALSKGNAGSFEAGSTAATKAKGEPVDWITIGCVSEKSTPRASAAGGDSAARSGSETSLATSSSSYASGGNNNYIVWTLTDFDTQITVFLFGEAYRQYWTEPEGSIFLVACPVILPAAQRRNFSLSVSKASQLLKLGTCPTFGRCKALKKDGAKCTMAISTQSGPFCVYHMAPEYQRMLKETFKGRADFGGGDASRMLLSRNGGAQLTLPEKARVVNISQGQYGDAFLMRVNNQLQQTPHASGANLPRRVTSVGPGPSNGKGFPPAELHMGRMPGLTVGSDGYGYTGGTPAAPSAASASVRANLPSFDHIASMARRTAEQDRQARVESIRAEESIYATTDEGLNRTYRAGVLRIDSAGGIRSLCGTQDPAQSAAKRAENKEKEKAAGRGEEWATRQALGEAGKERLLKAALGATSAQDVRKMSNGQRLLATLAGAKVPQQVSDIDAYRLSQQQPPSQPVRATQQSLRSALATRPAAAATSAAVSNPAAAQAALAAKARQEQEDALRNSLMMGPGMKRPRPASADVGGSQRSLQNSTVGGLPTSLGNSNRYPHRDPNAEMLGSQTAVSRVADPLGSLFGSEDRRDYTTAAPSKETTPGPGSLSTEGIESVKVSTAPASKAFSDAQAGSQRMVDLDSDSDGDGENAANARAFAPPAKRFCSSVVSVADDLVQPGAFEDVHRDLWGSQASPHASSLSSNFSLGSSSAAAAIDALAGQQQQRDAMRRASTRDARDQKTMTFQELQAHDLKERTEYLKMCMRAGMGKENSTSPEATESAANKKLLSHLVQAETHPSESLTTMLQKAAGAAIAPQATSSCDSQVPPTMTPQSIPLSRKDSSVNISTPSPNLAILKPRGPPKPTSTAAAIFGSGNVFTDLSTLGMTSQHQDEGTDARFQQYAERLGRLEKIEEMENKMKEVTSRVVTHWFCMDCEKWYRKPSPVCQQENHAVHPKKRKEWAMRCDGCHVRIFHPSEKCMIPCPKCNKRVWTSTSVYNIKDATSDLPNLQPMMTTDPEIMSLRYS